jgi:Ca2+-binding EF-hand superfamily protein
MMSETFEKLKEQLAKQGNLSEDDINKMVEAHGQMSDDERTQLAAAVHEATRTKDQKITMEQYLAASKVLDTAAEGSDEYKQALKIVEAYEQGG